MSFMPDILSSPRLSAVPVVLMSMILSVPTVNVGGLASVVTLKNNNRIKLFDITGNLLFSKKFYYDSFSLNISSLSSGIYILRLENDLGLKNKKLIIR